MVRLYAGFARFDDAGCLDATGCARQHEAGHALRVGERELHAGPSTHRLADDCGALHTCVVHDCAHVAGEVAGMLVLGSALRPAPSAMVECNDLVAAGEVGYLLPPDKGVAARAVRQDDGRAFAVGLVVDFRVVSVDEGHVFQLLFSLGVGQKMPSRVRMWVRIGSNRSVFSFVISFSCVTIIS